MRSTITIVTIFFLAGLVFAFWPETERRFELSWFWHEHIEGCEGTSELKGGFQFIKKYRPRGLSRQQCIAILGNPIRIDESTWKVDGKQVNLDDLNFQKRGAYDLSLVFHEDTCISIGLMNQPCSNEIHKIDIKQSGLTYLPPSLKKDFEKGSYSQPDYKPAHKYEAVYQFLNKPSP